MSYAIPSYYEEPVQLEVRDLIFIPRSRFQWVYFLVPLLCCGMSWAAGGIPSLTDLGFLIFTALCFIFLVIEFYMFPRRFGIGGLLLWGGTLCWFCQDYFTHWFQRDWNNPGLQSGIPQVVVSEAAFLHVLFILLMSVGLNITAGKWAEKLMLIIPEPNDPRFFLYVLLSLWAIGLTPYLFFTSEPFYMGVWHAATACWTQPVAFTVYRDGNLNYQWGAYVGQILAIGEVSGIVAIFYTIIVAKTWPSRIIGLFIWSFYSLIQYQTGRRGAISFTLLPPISLLFIKYHVHTAAMFKKFSMRAYVVCGGLTVFLLLVVQIQGRFRAVGLEHVEVGKVNIFENAGNTMFSEGLKGYSVIPEKMNYFYAADFPGEGFITCLPRTLFEFLIGPIPRALWHNKPIDKLWVEYNKIFIGSGNGIEGTTISHGLVGGFYFKYGMGGVIEGALLVGWLMGVCERTLQNSGGRPVGMLMSLGLSSWLFRTYRDFIFIDLYGFLIGALALGLLTFLFRPILGGAPQSSGTG